MVLRDSGIVVKMYSYECVNVSITGILKIYTFIQGIMEIWTVIKIQMNRIEKRIMMCVVHYNLE